MTEFSLSDIVIGSDILDETKLKPWWEKILEYCFRALVFTSFLIIYVVDSSKSTRCTQSRNGNCSLSSPESFYVNNICFQELHFVLIYSGHLALLGCTLLYLPYVWWGLRPSVIAIFHTVWKVDQIIRERHLEIKEIEHFTTGSDLSADCIRDSRDTNNTDDIVEIRKVVNDVRSQMYLGQKSSNLLYSYIIRNSLTVLVLILNLSLALVWLCFSSRFFDSAFLCNLDNVTTGSMKCVQFLCSNELAHKIFVYAIIWLILTSVATVCAGLGLYNAINSRIKKCDHLTGEAQLISQNYAFITMFSNHSHPLHDTTRTMLSMLSTRKMQDNMLQHLQNIRSYWDENFMSIFTEMFKDGKKIIVDAIFRHDSSPRPFYDSIYQYILDLKDYKRYCELHSRNNGSSIKCPCDDINLDGKDLRLFITAIFETTYDAYVVEHLVCRLSKLKSWDESQIFINEVVNKLSASNNEKLIKECLKKYTNYTSPVTKPKEPASEPLLPTEVSTGNERPGTSKQP